MGREVVLELLGGTASEDLGVGQHFEIALVFGDGETKFTSTGSVTSGNGGEKNLKFTDGQKEFRVSCGPSESVKLQNYITARDHSERKKLPSANFHVPHLASGQVTTLSVTLRIGKVDISIQRPRREVGTEVEVHSGQATVLFPPLSKEPKDSWIELYSSSKGSRLLIFGKETDAYVKNPAPLFEVNLDGYLSSTENKRELLLAHSKNPRLIIKSDIQSAVLQWSDAVDIAKDESKWRSPDHPWWHRSQDSDAYAFLERRVSRGTDIRETLESARSARVYFDDEDAQDSTERRTPAGVLPTKEFNKLKLKHAARVVDTKLPLKSAREMKEERHDVLRQALTSRDSQKGAEVAQPEVKKSTSSSSSSSSSKKTEKKK